MNDLHDLVAKAPCCPKCTVAGRVTYRARIDYHNARAQKYGRLSIRFAILAIACAAFSMLAALVALAR